MSDLQDDRSSEIVAQLGVLRARGSRTTRAVDVLEEALRAWDADRALELASVLASHLQSWRDDDAAVVVDAVASALVAGRPLEPTAVGDLIAANVDGDRQAVPKFIADCIVLNPPAQITVVRRLSQIGSQKVVYEATWHSSRRNVVLKRFTGPESARQLIPRELQPHPLSMAHPNIIETHLLSNSDGEDFLVERLLPVALHDGWRAGGATEAANLLHHIASALDFLQHRRLVHGDVKPDNIGYDGGSYILLDFGICRPVDEMTDDMTATGSLRTRAPELLCGEGTHSHASDIWALAATVFNTVVGEFPLIDAVEHVPRISEPHDRQRFEEQLKARVSNEWRDRVAGRLSGIYPERLRELIGAAMSQNPDDRPAAADIARRCRIELAPMIRTIGTAEPLSASAEVRQLKRHLDPTALRLLPVRKRTDLFARLDELSAVEHLDPGERAAIDELKQELTSLQ